MKLTVVSNPLDGGEVTVQPASGDGKYYRYDNVTLTAAPRPGYVFVSWTGHVSEIEDAGQPTILVEMTRYYPQNTEELEIVANFAREKSFPWVWLGVGLGGGLVVLVSLGLLLFRFRAKAAASPPAASGAGRLAPEGRLLLAAGPSAIIKPHLASSAMPSGVVAAQGNLDPLAQVRILARQHPPATRSSAAL